MFRLFNVEETQRSNSMKEVDHLRLVFVELNVPAIGPLCH
jgi:hypothetical protein